MEENTPVQETGKPQKSVGQKIKRSLRNWGCGVLVVLALLAASYVYWQYYFVFGSGVKSGTLNYVVLKGNLFKTYEGKLILEGITSTSQGQLQSNMFVFSIEDEELAQKLMRMSGKQVELGYKEYHGKLPWRGYSEFIVDELLSAEK